MQQQTVHLFILDTLADWEPGYAVAGINAPMVPGQHQFRVQTVGSTRAPIRSVGGVTMVPDMTLDELRPADSAMLILPGADTWHEPRNIEAVRKAQQFLANGVPVAAICGATVALAQAGVFDQRRHTSNAPQQLDVEGYNGAALYEGAPAVTEGDLITAGSTASLDFAYHIFRRLGVYSDDVLEAWYGLFKTGDAAYFMRLQELAAAQT